MQDNIVYACNDTLTEFIQKNTEHLHIDSRSCMQLR